MGQWSEACQFDSEEQQKYSTRFQLIIHLVDFKGIALFTEPRLER